MHKICKEMLKSHVRHIMPIFSRLLLKMYWFVVCFSYFFSLSHFDFTMYFYILVLPKCYKTYIGKFYNYQNLDNHIYCRKLTVGITLCSELDNL